MSSFELSAIRGPLVGRVFAIGEGVVWFGRTPEATIPVSSHLASRRHAELKVENGTPVLRDLNSANGTRLNGERIQARALSIGDVIEIGEEAFKLSGTDTPTLPQRGALTAVRGPLAGRSFPLEDKPLTLGRALDSSVVLHSQRASRRHAEVRVEPRGACLYDLGSGNGTYVNGTRATWRFLAAGDVIEIGEEAFRFEPPAVLPAVASTQPAVSVPSNMRAASSPLAQSIPGEEGWGSSQTPQAPRAASPMVKGTVPIAVVPQHQQPPVAPPPQQLPPVAPPPPVPPQVAQTYPSPVGYPAPQPQQAYPPPYQAHPAYQQPPYQPQQVYQPPPYAHPPAPPPVPPYQAPQQVPPPPPAPPAPQAAPGVPPFGVMCPKCRRVVDARFQDCPWDGTSLVNGRSLA